MNEIIEDFEHECTVQERERIVSINLNYRDVTQIGFVKEKYRQIQELYLNHNLIESLDGIQQFFNLQILSLKFNMIVDVEEILKILNKKQLRSLNLIGNPAEKDPRCSYTYFQGFFPNMLCFNDESNSTPKKQQPRETAITIKKIDPLYREYVAADFEMRVREKSASRQSSRIKNKSRSPVTKRVSSTQRDTHNSRGMLNLNTEPVFLKEFDMNSSYFNDTNCQKTATFAQAQGHARRPENNRQHFGNFSVNSVNSERFSSQNWDLSIISPSNESSNIYIDPSNSYTSIRKSRAKENINPVYTKQDSHHHPRLSHSRSSKHNMDMSTEEGLSMQSNIFEKHISNLEKDIEDLARIFHNKHLTERAFQALKNNTLVNTQKNLIAEYSYRHKTLINVFFAWQSYINFSRKRAAVLRAQAISSHALVGCHPRTQRNTEEDTHGAYNRNAATARRDYYY